MIVRKYAALGLLSFIVILCTSFTTTDHPLQKSRLRKIVIDPGHGGFDSGAPGRYSYEKNVALAISLKLEEYLPGAPLSKPPWPGSITILRSLDFCSG